MGQQASKFRLRSMQGPSLGTTETSDFDCLVTVVAIDQLGRVFFVEHLAHTKKCRVVATTFCSGHDVPLEFLHSDNCISAVLPSVSSAPDVMFCRVDVDDDNCVHAIRSKLGEWNRLSRDLDSSKACRDMLDNDILRLLLECTREEFQELHAADINLHLTEWVEHIYEDYDFLPDRYTPAWSIGCEFYDPWGYLCTVTDIFDADSFTYNTSNPYLSDPVEVNKE